MNDDFIVDDEGIGYTDRGGELWEYDEDNENKQKKKKKKVEVRSLSFSYHSLDRDVFHCKLHEAPDHKATQEESFSEFKRSSQSLSRVVEGHNE